MSYLDAILAFEQYFETHWALTPVFWTNTPFDPPRDSVGNAQPYVAITVREGAVDEITLGSENPWCRPSGMVMIQIFTLERTGQLLAGQYADIIKGIFRRVVALSAKTDISILAVDNSFNSITTDFLTQGFVVGLSFTVSGSANVGNVGVFNVVSVTQRKIIVSPSGLVDEIAGTPFSFHAVKNFNYRNSGLIRPRAANIISVGVVSGWYQTNVTIPYSRDVQS